MESGLDKKLEQLARDKAAQEKLLELFSELKKERDLFQKRLELLERAIENDYDSIMITEPELEKPGPRVVYVNDGFTEMTGYDREEVIGKTPRILQGPKTDRAVLDRLKNNLKEGKSFFGQTVNYKKDGSEFVNQWDIHPLTDEQGNLTHWVSYQHDITERKRAEKVLVDTQKEFDTLREASGRTVVDIDLHGNIVMANKAFRDLVGYSKDELRKIKVWDLFPKKYRESLRGRFDLDNGAEKFDRREFRGIIKHKKGIPIQIEGRTKLMDLKDQMLIRAEISNISLQKRIMESLKKRNEDFARIFEKASEYTYRVRIEDGEPVVEVVSEKFPELTGLSPKAITKKGGLAELVHEDDLDEVKSHFKKAFDGKSCTCNYRIRSADQNYIKIVDYAKPEWDTEGESVTAVKGAVSLPDPAGVRG